MLRPALRYDRPAFAAAVLARRGLQPFEDAARDAGVSVATLRRIEEQKGFPTLATFLKVWSWLGAPLHVLLPQR